jgi:hypothetical protein
MIGIVGFLQMDSLVTNLFVGETGDWRLEIISLKSLISKNPNLFTSVLQKYSKIQVIRQKRSLFLNLWWVLHYTWGVSLPRDKSPGYKMEALWACIF